jgi:hypothetical protein
MARVEEMQLGVRDVAQVSVGAGLGEERVVAAPRDEHRRRVPAQPSLPLRVQRDVGVVVEGQVQLRPRAARQIQEVLVESLAVPHTRRQ